MHLPQTVRRRTAARPREVEADAESRRDNSAPYRAAHFKLERWGERPRKPVVTIDPTNGSPGVSPHRSIKTAALICFKDTFPHLVREHVDDDTDFLVNLTNNG